MREKMSFPLDDARSEELCRAVAMMKSYNADFEMSVERVYRI